MWYMPNGSIERSTELIFGTVRDSSKRTQNLDHSHGQKLQIFQKCKKKIKKPKFC